MGRIEEAETALNQALELEPENTTALANRLVLDTVAGREVSGTTNKLESLEPGHDILEDFAAKREAFRSAMGKYQPKFEP